MTLRHTLSRRQLLKSATAAGLALAAGPVFAAEPIRIGFAMSLTGPNAGAGKMFLVGREIWRDELNAKGGLLGRPVEFVYYDDQSNPSTVPGIYTKLLDVDKVDVIVSGYATNMQAPAMPVVMQRGMMFVGLFGLAVNDQFKYDRFFQMMPSGPNARIDFSKGFLDIA